MRAEEWRPVGGYEGLYEVSSLGRVRALFEHRNLKPGRILALWRTSTNRGPTAVRYRVSLSRAGKRRYPVHLLVCEAFHGPRPTREHQAAHGDGDGLNNAASNLRWTLPPGNYDDMKRHGHHRAATLRANGKLSDDQVHAIRTLRTAGRKLDDLARQFDVDRSHICAVARGRRRAA